MHVLRDQRDLVTQRLEGIFPQVVTIKQDLALVDIVETGNQAGNGRLARTGTTDQRNGFTRRDGQADITQRRRFTAWIGKGDVTEFQVAFSALDHACTFIFFSCSESRMLNSV